MYQVNITTDTGRTTTYGTYSTLPAAECIALGLRSAGYSVTVDTRRA